MYETGGDLAALTEAVTTVRSALAMPARDGTDQKVVDAAGAPVIDAIDIRHDKVAIPSFADRSKVSASARLGGRWLFGGVYWLHFGHFMFETCARMWAVPQLQGRVDGIAFFRGRTRREPPRIFSDVLAHLGVDLPVHFIDEPTEFEQLIVPRQGCGLGALASGTPAFRRFMRDRLQMIAPRTGADRIYLSREAYRLRRGGIFAESHLRELLDAEGYTAFAPERHSFEEQVATYLGARHIVGPDSSALHLVGFAAPPLAEVAIVLRRDGGERDMLPQLAGFMGRPPLVVDAITQMYHRENERNPSWSMFAELDFPKVGAALAGAGFIDGHADWSALRRIKLRRVLASYERNLGGPIHPVPRGNRPEAAALPDGSLSD